MSDRPRVFVARLIPDEGLRLVTGATDADVWDGDLPPPRDELLRRVAGCDGVLTLLTDQVDDEFLDAAGPQLRVVSNYAVGFDNIDVPACTRRGIPVGNTPGVLTDTTADLAFALLMAAARRVAEGERYVRAGRWQTWGPMLLLGPDVHGATIGIVGFGRIGQAMARRAAGFGMTVLYHDIGRLPAEVTGSLGVTYSPLDELLERSDYVSLHVNLTPETRHLINATTLARMKPTAILVNTSRGPVVDQHALFEALRDGVIWAAALDVTDPEPIPMDDPLVGLPNCLIVPHIASASRATRGRMAEMAAANLLAGLRGERLPTPVNPDGRLRRRRGGALGPRSCAGDRRPDRPVRGPTERETAGDLGPPRSARQPWPERP
jgi:glyoxylate reductase